MWRQTQLIGFFLTLAVSYHSNAEIQKKDRIFEIDYANNRFLKDGEPFRYVSGSIHYFRVHPTVWADRLCKLRWAGFNAVQTYVEWSSHEPEPDVYDFSGPNDLEKFIRLAQEEDLMVILRVGPFICAERDMGGLPYWLLRLHPNIRLRTSDPDYLKYVEKWLVGILLPKIKPLLYENGGPIIMLQVENEYGSSGESDYAYTSHLRDLFKEALGDRVVLFTTDSTGTRNLKVGKIPLVYATVDFGIDADPDKIFADQRLFEPKGPLVNSEFYAGWDDHWGEPHHTRDGQALARVLDEILARNGSVNMYMFHGGTSFGLTSGSNLDSKFQASPTSYDYDAPLSEAGDTTDKYFALRNVIQKYLPVPVGPKPPLAPKGDYGKAFVNPLGSMRSLALTLENYYTSEYPMTFEALRMSTGIVVYSTQFKFRIPDPARLTLNELHDRAYVFLDGELSGVVSREQQLYDVAITARPGLAEHTLDIVVESQGRISVGIHFNDFKGITTNVTLNDHVLKGWRMTPLPLHDMCSLKSALQRLDNLLYLRPDSTYFLGTPPGGMTFYSGSFDITNEPKDTFLLLEGWGKGIVWVNDFNLGRYWPEVGPQVTLYVPLGILKEGSNSITLLELEYSPCRTSSQCYVTFQNHHQINGLTPK